MDEGRSLIRTGWGLFYDKTNFGQLNSYVTSGVNVASVTAQFPADNIDPGPRAGQLPDRSDAGQRSGRQLRAAQRAVSIRSARRGTPATCSSTHPDRLQPYTQQTSVGYQRQLGRALSASADYVHTMARDQWELENLNPGLRVNTTASGAINRVDPTYVTNVWQRQNIGELHLRRAERGPGKARLQQLERPRLVHAGVFARQHQRRRDRDEQLPAAERLQSRARTRTDRL